MGARALPAAFTLSPQPETGPTSRGDVPFPALVGELDCQAMTGYQIAQAMKPDGVSILCGSSDWYDPKSKTIYLSRSTAWGTDLYAHANAAHESAHAVQHVTLKRCFRLWRSPIVQDDRIGGVLLLLTLVASIHGHWAWAFAGAMVLIGAIRYGSTLWLEREASLTAALWLDSRGLATDETLDHLRKCYEAYVTRG